ncbi:MAG: phosphatidate cytidylyltransferase [Candidatus Sericytochromatia bacterium]|nr:phosphatidate cytidylyltransferase [Candidatus Sericytochromatia bacterium]
MNSDAAIAEQFVRTLAAFVVGGAGLIGVSRALVRRQHRSGPPAALVGGAVSLSGVDQATSSLSPETAVPPTAVPEPTVLKTPLWVRLGTLLALAVAVFVPAFVSLQAWAGVVCVLVTVALAEFWALLEKVGVAPHRLSGFLAGLALPVAAYLGGPAALLPALMAAFLLLATVTLLSRGEGTVLQRLAGAWLGVCYVGLLGAFWILIHRAGGFGALVFFLMVVQLADVGGLMAGILGGRHKLAPALSPNKTWEGLAGSVLAAALAAWAFAFALPTHGLPLLCAVGVLLALAGLVGDLLASAFKRSGGLKDFGQVLPGHGGVLDRFDGYLFTAPIFWALLTWA